MKNLVWMVKRAQYYLNGSSRSYKHSVIKIIPDVISKSQEYSINDIAKLLGKISPNYGVTGNEENIDEILMRSSYSNYLAFEVGGKDVYSAQEIAAFLNSFSIGGPIFDLWRPVVVLFRGGYEENVAPSLSSYGFLDRVVVEENTDRIPVLNLQADSGQVEHYDPYNCYYF